MRPLTGNAPLSRDDIRKGRVRRVVDEDKLDAAAETVTTTRRRIRLPLGGFLGGNGLFRDSRR